MINILLKGGLGNQLFQYAFGLSAAQQHDCQLTLIDSLVHASTHKYALKDFSLNAHLRNSFALPYARTESRRARYLNNFLPWVNLENSLTYDPWLVEKSKYRLNIGYYQSECYFRHGREQLLSSLALNDTVRVSEHLGSNKTHRKDEVPVSLHIRRGDYISDQGASKIHGFVGEEYYKKATELIEHTLKLTEKRPLFFIFSDEPEWASRFCEQLGLNFKLISSQRFSASQELHLMSKCTHNIIANSSFSWWGTYLNSEKNKITIAPKNWYADRRVHSIYIKDWKLL